MITVHYNVNLVYIILALLLFLFCSLALNVHFMVGRYFRRRESLKQSHSFSDELERLYGPRPKANTMEYEARSILKKRQEKQEKDL